jgi:hypothetical protein
LAKLKYYEFRSLEPKKCGWYDNLEIDILRVILSIILLFFLPGFFLVQALFPLRNELDEEDDFLYRIALAVAFSIVITTLDGFILGSLGINPASGKGYWDTPYIIGSLLGISLVFFLVGWYRGAYPILGRRPTSETPLKLPKKDKDKFYMQMDDWKKQQKELEKLNEQLKDGDVTDIKAHKMKIDKISKKLETLETEMIKMGHKEIPTIKAKGSTKKSQKRNFKKLK